MEHELLLAALRRRLRAAGLTQADVAKKLEVGTATVKRWLHGRGLGLRTLSQLCALADTTLTEIAEEAAVRDRSSDKLTLAQEKALTSSPELSTIFFIIVTGWPVSEAEEGFGIPADHIAQHVDRLERLALIDRLPGGRLRARLDPAHVWQREPMRRHFEQHMKHLFFTPGRSRATLRGTARSSRPRGQPRPAHIRPPRRMARHPCGCLPGRAAQIALIADRA
jgi:transcriptional regulator with XRE-family HTH domain